MIAPIDRRVFPIKPSANETADRAAHVVMDTDGNGKLSQDEWARSGRDAASFHLFDADKDGAISEDEFAKTRKYEREFNEKDRDGSGVLGRLEFQANKFITHFGGGVLHKMEATEKVAEKAFVGTKDMMLRCMPPFIRDRFASFDTDRNCTVSKEEYIEGRRREERPIKIHPFIQPTPLYKLAGAEAKIASNG